ncbi:MAG TPA: hypothetical protein PKA28_19060 [Methylomusa anaerophila]|uniref:Uncharacterized protein n=1 Tax=Methylomusa anaerophila TaxID=1930071 RepID=A0A348AIB1_9FIRM|nr:hypothetical protein [Methylomusa anaerophila]BBB90809.1 hypothetical protein MAMMFC1_01470 [Methylomusa anaerophila]HML90534.1 hypothetical protein [Methylomusa anaerophila]
MPKVVVLTSELPRLAAKLRETSYIVIDSLEAMRPGISVDAVVCTGYRQDIAGPVGEFLHADISIGTHAIHDYHPAFVLNATGQSPDEIIGKLHQLFAGGSMREPPVIPYC